MLTAVLAEPTLTFSLSASQKKLTFLTVDRKIIRYFHSCGHAGHGMDFILKEPATEKVKTRNHLLLMLATRSLDRRSEQERRAR